MTSSNNQLRELTTGEIDVVAGGHPAIILAFPIGFALGFIGVCAFGPTGFGPGDYPTTPKDTG